jgi:small multidrug resistance pump
MKAYLFLIAAILCEVLATSFLKASEQFTRVLPSLVTIAGYTGAFFFLGHSLKSIPVGTAYAMWSGLGTVSIIIVGVIFFKQRLDWAAISGVLLIIAGVVIINLLSKSAVHQ